jgi:dCMP deaminase
VARPNWDEYFMSVACLISKRSACLSRQVGAVIVKDRNSISFGYNGPAAGLTHCEDLGGCRRRKMPDYKSGAYLDLCPAAHGEQNAIAYAAKNCISTDGCTIYVNTFPCKDCMNSIINSGIKKIVYLGEYNSDLAKNICKEAGIELQKFEGRSLEEIVNN